MSSIFGPAGLLIGLAIFIVVFEVYRPKRLPFDFLFIFNVSYLVYFALAPIHILIGGREFVPTSMLSVYDNYLAPSGQWTELFFSVVIILAYAFVITGYFSRSARFMGLRVKVVYLRREALYAVTIVFSCIGILALILYGMQYGGVTEVILKGVLIRGGVETTDSSVLFVMHFIQFINSASIVLFAILIEKSAHEARGWLRLIFLLSIGLVLIAVLAIGARRSIVLYSAALYFIYANMTGRRLLHIMAMLGVGFLAILMFGDAFLIGLSSGFSDIQSQVSGLVSSGSIFLYQAVWRDLTLPYIEFVGIAIRFEGWPRVFIDVPMAILEALPQSLVPIELPALLVEESTKLLSGLELGDIVAIPTGFLGYGWYNGLLPGLIISCLVFGWLGGLMESAFRIDSMSGAAATVVYVLTGIAWAYSIRVGIPGMILNERFHWIVLVLLLLFLSEIIVSKRFNRISLSQFHSRGVTFGRAKYGSK